MNALHIPHNQWSSEEVHVKLLKLFVPSISQHQPNGNGYSHMNADTYISLRKVAEEYDEKMKNLNTPSDMWHQIVQKQLSNF